jgi:hypothetical protein
VVDDLIAADPVVKCVAANPVEIGPAAAHPRLALTAGYAVGVAIGHDHVRGTVRDAFDQALADSVIGLYKIELINPQRPWKTADEVESPYRRRETSMRRCLPATITYPDARPGGDET